MEMKLESVLAQGYGNGVDDGSKTHRGTDNML